jgi:hypothetical protein
MNFLIIEFHHPPFTFLFLRTNMICYLTLNTRTHCDKAQGTICAQGGLHCIASLYTR